MLSGRTDRRRFLRTLGGGTAVLTLSPLLSACSRRVRKPNIVLIMADDLGYEGLGCNGGTSYRTPVLDELARTGMRFQNCHSQPLCTPSRVQIMTGRYNQRNYTEFGTLPPGEVTFGHLLQEAGYATCVAGKWQLAGRVEGANYRGDGVLPEDTGFAEHCLWQVENLGSRYWDPLIRRNGELLEPLEGEYGPDVCCDYINDFIRRHVRQPFFAYYPMILTHDPFLPTPDSDVDPGERGIRNDRFFGDMVSYMDGIVGRIVGNLDELGLRGNTLVIFTSDNGTHRRISSRMGARAVQGAKGRTIDTGTHVPLIANWPGNVTEGVVCEDLVDFTDFLPTLLDLTGAEADPETIVDGRSFLPQLYGEEGNPREWIFCHYDPKWGNWEPARFARDKRWKLYQDGSFFDLASDPLEENPLDVTELDQAARDARGQLRAVLDWMR